MIISNVTSGHIRKISRIKAALWDDTAIHKLFYIEEGALTKQKNKERQQDKRLTFSIWIMWKNHKYNVSNIYF